MHNYFPLIGTRIRSKKTVGVVSSFTKGHCRYRFIFLFVCSLLAHNNINTMLVSAEENKVHETDTCRSDNASPSSDSNNNNSMPKRQQANATTTTIPRLSEELVHEILQYNEIYTDNDEYEACRVSRNCFSDDERFSSFVFPNQIFSPCD